MAKYGNRRTSGYASKREAKKAQELRLLQKAGEIQGLEEQVVYELLPAQRRDDGKMERPVRYIADFRWVENGFITVADAKGYRTKDYVIKRKLMLFIHGISVVEL